MSLVYDFILVMGATITIIVLFLLIRQKVKQFPQYILITLFSFFLLTIIYFYAILHEVRTLQLITQVPRETIGWVVGPAMFIYVRSLFFSGKKIFRSIIFHLTPFLIYLFSLSVPTLIYDSLNNGSNTPVFEYLKIHFEYGDREADLRDIYMIFYFIWTLKILKQYQSALKSNYSNLTFNDFNWIKHFLIGGVIIAVSDLILSAYMYFYKDPGFVGPFLVILALIALISYLGYNGTNQSSMLLPDFLFEGEAREERKNTRLSGIGNDKLDNLTEKLKTVLKNEKPYLEPDLTLAKLADLIQISDKELSALLNQHMNISFFDIINKYRVDEVKDKITQPEYEHLTLLGLAYECGFNSKTSFNRIFKKDTGLSPSEFKKSQKNKAE